MPEAAGAFSIATCARAALEAILSSCVLHPRPFG